MSYIEKEKLIKADIDSIENRVRHAFNQGYDIGYKEGKERAKPQEQEPTTKNDLGVDCISRAEVLKLMQDNWHTHNGDWAMQESMDDIRALPSVTPQEPRWIPVSERYPKIEDEYKYFLVTDDKGKVSAQEFFMSLDEEPQPYFSGMLDVTAWMPLPQPYREVKG